MGLWPQEGLSSWLWWSASPGCRCLEKPWEAQVRRTQRLWESRGSEGPPQNPQNPQSLVQQGLLRGVASAAKALGILVSTSPGRALSPGQRAVSDGVGTVFGSEEPIHPTRSPKLHPAIQAALLRSPGPHGVTGRFGGPSGCSPGLGFPP